MRDGNWDLEDVKLGPVRTRYRQPNLLVDEERFSSVVAAAKDAMTRHACLKVLSPADITRA